MLARKKPAAYFFCVEYLQISGGDFVVVLLRDAVERTEVRLCCRVAQVAALHRITQHTLLRLKMIDIETFGRFNPH